MKKWLLFIFVLTACALKGQSVRHRTMTMSGTSLSYAVNIPEETPERFVFGILDSTSAEWNSVTWCSQLAKISGPSNTLVVVPELTKEMNTDQISKMHSAFLDSVDHENVVIVSLGQAADLAIDVASKGVSALLISPKVELKSIDVKGTHAFSLYETSHDVGLLFLRDSLVRDSQWVKLKKTSSHHPFYIDNYVEAYGKTLNWIDSVESILQDSIAMERKSMLLNKLPEVTRQGTSIDVRVYVAAPGRISLQVKDLSAKMIHKEERFFGIGNGKMTLDTTNLEWGVYYLEIEGSGIKEQIKIMIRG